MNIRILYHGLGMAGKTTNLEKLKEIYSSYTVDRVHQQTKEGRTVYLDMLNLNIKTKVGGQTLTVHLFTTPGQERFKMLRSWLFGGIDGLVFVLDSTRHIMENLKAYQELSEYNITDTPVIVQANKRDKENILPIELIKRAFPGKMIIEAVASQGLGVAETFKAVLKEAINAKHNLKRV